MKKSQWIDGVLQNLKQRADVDDDHVRTAPDCAAPAFTYNGVPFDPEQWTCASEDLPSPRRGQKIRKMCWTAPDGTLELSLVFKWSEALGIVEYAPKLRNLSTKTGGLIADWQSLAWRWNCHTKNDETLLTRDWEAAGVRVRCQRGSIGNLYDFVPEDRLLSPGIPYDCCIMESTQGRSSNNYLPFFGVDIGEFNHCNFAVGWSGAWRAEITARRGLVDVTIGLLASSFRLDPGEEIELPQIVIQSYQGEDIAEMQNRFRRYMLDYQLPRDGKGKLLLPPRSIMFSGTVPNEALLKFIGLFRKAKLPLDVIWIDAGWYGLDRDVAWELHESDWWKTVGNWRVNQKIHPGGLRPVADAAHQAGYRLLLWVEIARAVKDVPVMQEHPDWFIGDSEYNRMLDLGNPAACDYAISVISNLIEHEHIDCYREDFNFDTLPIWREGDEKLGCRGLTEIRFINGFWRFWRTLRQHYPDLLIDNCASGGRRIDWATLGLSLPMWRSDFSCGVSQYNCEANQLALSYLSNWLPFHSSGHMLTPGKFYDYASASAATSIFNNCDRCWFLPDPDNADCRRILRNIKKRGVISEEIRECCTGDFYRLTAEPERFNRLVAVQFHLPKRKCGCILAFRRPWSKDNMLPLSPRAIKASVQYEIEDVEHSRKFRLSGEELQNFLLELPKKRSAVILFYREC